MKQYIAITETAFGFKYKQYATIAEIEKDMPNKDYIAVYELKLRAKTELKEVSK